MIGKENIPANYFSGLLKTGNQKDTHNFNYRMETIPKKYYIDEFPEGIFPITFERIYLFQWKTLYL